MRICIFMYTYISTALQSSETRHRAFQSAPGAWTADSFSRDCMMCSDNKHRDLEAAETRSRGLGCYISDLEVAETVTALYIYTSIAE